MGSILGHIVPLGDWFFTEMTMLFLAGAVLIGIVYGFNEKKIVDLFIYGAKDILSVALIFGSCKRIVSDYDRWINHRYCSALWRNVAV